jgi:hypothetical protein
MTAILQLRTRALRYRELAGRYPGDSGAALRGAADELERQANALEAYEAAVRPTAARALTLSA